MADRYEVVELLGQGGMGQVWRGRDVRLERPVAVKVLQPHLLKDPVRDEVLSRFQREGRAAARLTHGNIATIHDIGEHDGMPYLVLEYLPGPDLQSLLRRHPDGLPIERVLRFGAHVAEGLAAAHTAGIVHRDVKPANLMLAADGTVKVCDFGIARLLGDVSGLTGRAVIGTVAYMAPEQITGKSVDHRADLYALGATVFHLLTGRPVFTGDEPRAVLSQHLAVPPPPARSLRADTPAELEACLLELLAKEPDQRPKEAAAVAERLHYLWRRHADPDRPGKVLPGRRDQAITTLRTRHAEAEEHAKAHRYSVAVTILQTLLDDCQGVLGPEQPDILNVRRDLAHWTGWAGDAAAARDQLADLVPIFERVHGPDELKSLGTRSDLAEWTGKTGDAAAARDQIADLLPTVEHVLGPESPYTLHIRSDFARWTGKAGDAAAARDRFADLLLVRERVLGPLHSETLGTRHYLAEWTREAGDTMAAYDLLADLLPTLERVLGPEHSYTVYARGDLARWTGDFRRTGDSKGDC